MEMVLPVRKRRHSPLSASVRNRRAQVSLACPLEANGLQWPVHYRAKLT